MNLVVGDVWVVAVAVAWTFLPGLVLVLALGVRNWIVLLGAPVPVGLALNTIASEAVALVGARYAWWSMLVVTALAVGLAAGVRFALRRRASTSGRDRSAAVELDEAGASERDDARDTTPFGPERGPAGAVLLGTGGVLLVASPLLAALTWWRGIGPIGTYNQDHDSIHHQVLTAYIQMTGRGAPWEVMPGDVLTGASPHAYPAGLHRLAALVGAAAGDPVSGLNASLIALCGIAWTLSAAALTAAIMRTHESALCWQVAAAGATALLAAGAYRPIVQYVRDNGVMANAVALALVPGVVAVLLTVRKALAGLSVVAGLACAGVVATHPSSVVSVGVTALAVAVGQLGSRPFRAVLPGIVRSLLVVGGVAAVLSAPTALGALGAAGGTTQFPPAGTGVSVAQKLGTIVTVPYGGFLDPSYDLVQSALLVLVCVGLTGTLLMRQAIGLTAAWAVWVVIVVSLSRDALHGPFAVLGGFFYNSVDRVVPHVGLLVPGLGALGVLTVVVAVRGAAVGVLRVWGSRDDRARQPRRTQIAAVAAAGVFALLVLGYAAGPSRSYATRAADALGDRWSSPEFDRVNEHDRAAARFLADNVAPGERVMNSANDGSTYAYVEYGVPVVNISTLGSDGQPYTYELLKSFDELDTDQQVRDYVVELNIAWVYVDAGAPIIGSEYTPQDWFPEPLFVLAPGLSRLSEIPELTREFSSGEVTVYRVDLDALRAEPAS